MTDGGQLAETALSELHHALDQCVDPETRLEAVRALWAVVERWVDLPEFKKGCDSLQVWLLNELTFSLSDPDFAEPAWEVIRRLAVKWELENEVDLKDMLRITAFEIFAEAPANPAYSMRLFSLASDESTRWAVFAAYENVPWRLRPHAAQYSGGTVSDADCDEWLVSRGLGDDEILMTRMPRNGQ